ncbi:MAG: hypothetical protein JWN66_3748 [Sphingomonas bacterium]|uniref:DUF4132 domain-containing protein n=1 Tax=Sphingomonas bacterium TaxID=1895847 RepID=UPI0026271AD7|nr:DUF4132 domain-containing protein [Sphingomonas bacterium]MDB5706632.1 hypothetical protein [Sphingomonas bacterium]
MTGIFGRIAGLFGGGSEPPSPPADPGFRERPRVAGLPQATEAERIIAAICAEVTAAQHGRFAAIKLTGIARWEELKRESDALQVEVALAAIVPRPRGSYSYTAESWTVEETRKTIASQLIRKKLPFTAAQLAGLIDQWASGTWLQYGIPGQPILGAVDRLLDGKVPDGPLRAALDKLRNRLLADTAHGQQNKFEAGTIARVAAMLEPGSVDTRALPAGAFATMIASWLDALDPAARDAWRALLLHAAGAGDKAKPVAKWLAEGAPLVAALGEDEVAARLVAWMEAVTPDPSRPDISLDMLKGVVWLSAGFAREGLAGPVGRFAEKCFRKVPGIGARSVKLGNAALWALSETSDAPGAAAELFRLRARLKLPSVQKLLDGRLATLADKLGSNVADLEDGSLPDFGLAADGTVKRRVGDLVATITVAADGVTLAWAGSDGRALKAPPASVQRDFKPELAALKQAVKDVEAARATQALRLEQGWQEDRSWDVAAWRRTFLDHPLRRQLALALIWRFDGEGGPVAAMPEGDRLATLAGDTALPETGSVRLWHPLDSDPEDVLAWRRRIMDLGITQPIKQAHREIYVLTDAERRTDIYSNRFAAHILRQHQFRALCQARGWRFEFLGGWDNWNVPSRAIPHHGLTIEYHVEAVDNDQRSAAYVPLHLATDQVRFIGADGRPVPLETVSPILFSEALRDVDLFVAVTSVANDPGWTDGGPEGRFGGYWREWAFGDLSQNAETRRALIASIAPKLAIADRLEIGDKFLVVRGNRQKYAIHFGSSNIQILPSNRYLCIVSGPAPKGMESIKLPFAGDSLLSIILSKAFLLADESRITDPTILRQL